MAFVKSFASIVRTLAFCHLAASLCCIPGAFSSRTWGNMVCSLSVCSLSRPKGWTLVHSLSLSLSLPKFIRSKLFQTFALHHLVPLWNANLPKPQIIRSGLGAHHTSDLLAVDRWRTETRSVRTAWSHFFEQPVCRLCAACVQSVLQTL